MSRSSRPRREGVEPPQNTRRGEEECNQDHQFRLMMASIQALSESVETLITQ